MRPLQLRLLPLVFAISLHASASPAETAAPTDPCKDASGVTNTAPVGWRAHISRRAAIFMIQHLREFCRLASEADASVTSDKLRSERQAVHERVLTPLYRAHPELETAQLPALHQRAGTAKVATANPTNFSATRRDISRKTAGRFVDELLQLQQQLGSLRPPADQLEAQTAIAEAERFSNVTAELSFAQTIATTAYPDLFKRGFRDIPEQPRTAESDAAFRKMAPPRGSVRLGDAAYRLIRSFMRQLRHGMPGTDQVISISWTKSMKRKGPDDSDWIDEGAGWTMGAFRRSEVPPDVIDRVRGLDVIFSAEDPSALNGKTFDLDKKKLVLRD